MCPCLLEFLFWFYIVCSKDFFSFKCFVWLFGVVSLISFRFFVFVFCLLGLFFHSVWLYFFIDIPVSFYRIKMTMNEI